MGYCREHKGEGVMFMDDKRVFGLCNKVNGCFRLVVPCGVNYQDVLSFRTKKEAQVFCKKHHIPYAHIVKFGNRFEECWALSLYGNTLTDTWVHVKNNFRQELA